jgi:hypothetical protein
MDKHKNLKANYSTLWESTKANPKATRDSSASTGKGCSICSNVYINALNLTMQGLRRQSRAKTK